LGKTSSNFFFNYEYYFASVVRNFVSSSEDSSSYFQSDATKDARTYSFSPSSSSSSSELSMKEIIFCGDFYILPVNSDVDDE
jgi:hypothetical protein